MRSLSSLPLTAAPGILVLVLTACGGGTPASPVQPVPLSGLSSRRPHCPTATSIRLCSYRAGKARTVAPQPRDLHGAPVNGDRPCRPITPSGSIASRRDLCECGSSAVRS